MSHLDKCEACEGAGYLMAAPEGYEAPYGMAFIERCDSCERYADDWEAAHAYGGSILAVLCSLARVEV